MVLQGVSGKTNTLYDRQGRLGLLQALAHTPSVGVTVTVTVVSWLLFTMQLCIYQFCVSCFMSCMRLSIAHACKCCNFVLHMYVYASSIQACL